VAKQAAGLMGRPFETLSLITLHLGNGASATAIQNGLSIDTSMGLTPLEGLIMGTRCGDLDPAIIFYLERETGRSSDAIDTLLNKESGLKGICGVNDMREIAQRAEAGNTDARLAIAIYVYRLRKYIGSYTAALGRLDALVFTGGIGENAAGIRAAACRDLEMLGIVIDEDKNRAATREGREIQSADSRVRILVIPTNEELEIADQTKRLLESAGGHETGDR
jgi:acetate kinase